MHTQLIAQLHERHAELLNTQHHYSKCAELASFSINVIGDTIAELERMDKEESDIRSRLQVVHNHTLRDSIGPRNPADIPTVRQDTIKPPQDGLVTAHDDGSSCFSVPEKLLSD